MSYQLRADLKSCRLPIPALGLWLAFLGPVYGQADDPRPSQSENPEVPERSEPEQGAAAMEEIVVTGQRAVTALIREGERLTEDFYMRLNDVLDNDDFRISCDDRRRIASNIVVRECRTEFQRRLGRYESAAFVAEFRDAQNDAAMQEVIGGPGGVEPPQIASSFDAEALSWQAEFGQAILIAVNSDPVLNQQVNRLLQLKSAIENYQSPREQRRERRRAQRESRRAADGQ